MLPIYWMDRLPDSAVCVSAGQHWHAPVPDVLLPPHVRVVRQERIITQAANWLLFTSWLASHPHLRLLHSCTGLCWPVLSSAASKNCRKTRKCGFQRAGDGVHSWVVPAFLHVGISTRELRHLKRFGTEVSSRCFANRWWNSWFKTRRSVSTSARPKLWGGGDVGVCQERTHSNANIRLNRWNHGTVCVCVWRPFV